MAQAFRQALLEEGGMPWPEARAWAYECPGIYTLRREDELHVVGPRGLLARLDLNGRLLFLAEEKDWEVQNDPGC